MEALAQDLGGSAGEDELATRAAWLYHAGGLTQSQVAERLGLATAKAHRLIARATRAGLVRVFVDGPIGGCIALERALIDQFDFDLCRVVPVLDEQTPPMRELGIAAATLLHDALDRGAHTVIGVGHGRTLAAAMDHLPRVPAPHVRLVSLLGGLPRRISTGPFDVIHRIAEKTSAEADLLPVPMFANSAADATVLRAQRGVAEALALAARASLKLAGIGAVSDAAMLPMAGMVAPPEVAELRAAGAVGEVLGRYFAIDGTLVDTPLHDRVVSIPVAAMQGLVAVAGGADKIQAIAAVLRSGLLGGLVTDEPTARRLVELLNPARAKGEEIHA